MTFIYVFIPKRTKNPKNAFSYFSALKNIGSKFSLLGLQKNQLKKTIKMLIFNETQRQYNPVYSCGSCDAPIFLGDKILDFSESNFFYVLEIDCINIRRSNTELNRVKCTECHMFIGFIKYYASPEDNEVRFNNLKVKMPIQFNEVSSSGIRE